MKTSPFKVLIPARYKSQRLPGKPLIDFEGRPMLEHVWRTARASSTATQAARQEEPRLRIAADAKASHESVVRVMEAARQLGLTRLAISSEERPASLPEQTE